MLSMGMDNTRTLPRIRSGQYRGRTNVHKTYRTMFRRIDMVRRRIERGDQTADWILDGVAAACEASRTHERCLMRTLLSLCESNGLTLSEAIRATYDRGHRQAMDPPEPPRVKGS